MKRKKGKLRIHRTHFPLLKCWGFPRQVWEQDAVRKGPVSRDEKRQLSCGACKLAWRIADTQPRHTAQVSRQGSRSATKIPSERWLWWRVNSATGLLLLKERGTLCKHISSSPNCENVPRWIRMIASSCRRLFLCRLLLKWKLAGFELTFTWKKNTCLCR